MALTTTAELTDAFRTKREGVGFVLDAAEAALDWRLLALTTEGELVDVAKKKLNIAAFGEAPDGDLFILPFEGKNSTESHIYRLVPDAD